jgi:hypothetical protein
MSEAKHHLVLLFMFFTIMAGALLRYAIHISKVRLHRVVEDGRWFNFYAAPCLSRSRCPTRRYYCCSLNRAVEPPPPRAESTSNGVHPRDERPPPC